MTMHRSMWNPVCLFIQYRIHTIDTLNLILKKKMLGNARTHILHWQRRRRKMRWEKTNTNFACLCIHCRLVGASSVFPQMFSCYPSFSASASASFCFWFLQFSSIRSLAHARWERAHAFLIIPFFLYRVRIWCGNACVLRIENMRGKWQTKADTKRNEFAKSRSWIVERKCMIWTGSWQRSKSETYRSLSYFSPFAFLSTIESLFANDKIPHLAWCDVPFILLACTEGK